MTRYRYDKELDAIVEVRDRSNYFEASKGPAIISDDIGAGVNGLRHMATGRYHDSKSKFRADTRASGCVETGNDAPRVYDDRPSQRERSADLIHDIRRSMGDFGSNTGADAARAFAERNRQ